MKKKKTDHFRITKVAIAKLSTFETQEIKGGTVPTDPNMTDHPNENNICFAAK